MQVFRQILFEKWCWLLVFITVVQSAENEFVIDTKEELEAVGGTSDKCTYEADFAEYCKIESPGAPPNPGENGYWSSCDERNCQITIRLGNLGFIPTHLEVNAYAAGADGEIQVRYIMMPGDPFRTIGTIGYTDGWETSRHDLQEIELISEDTQIVLRFASQQSTSHDIIDKIKFSGTQTITQSTTTTPQSTTQITTTQSTTQATIPTTTTATTPSTTLPPTPSTTLPPTPSTQPPTPSTTHTPTPSTTQPPTPNTTQPPTPSTTQPPTPSTTQPPTPSTTQPPTPSTTQPPTLSTTQPPTASTTQPPTASTTQPPTPSTTQPPTASTTQPPTPSTTQPPTPSTTQPPTPSTTQPPTPSTTQPPTQSTTQPPTPSTTQPPTASTTQPPTQSTTSSTTRPPRDPAELGDNSYDQTEWRIDNCEYKDSYQDYPPECKMNVTSDIGAGGFWSSCSSASCSIEFTLLQESRNSVLYRPTAVIIKSYLTGLARVDVFIRTFAQVQFVGSTSSSAWSDTAFDLTNFEFDVVNSKVLIEPKSTQYPESVDLVDKITVLFGDVITPPGPTTPPSDESGDDDNLLIILLFSGLAVVLLLIIIMISIKMYYMSKRNSKGRKRLESDSSYNDVPIPHGQAYGNRTANANQARPAYSTQPTWPNTPRPIYTRGNPQLQSGYYTQSNQPNPRFSRR